MAAEACDAWEALRVATAAADTERMGVLGRVDALEGAWEGLGARVTHITQETEAQAQRTAALGEAVTGAEGATAKQVSALEARLEAAVSAAEGVRAEYVGLCERMEALEHKAAAAGCNARKGKEAEAAQWRQAEEMLPCCLSFCLTGIREGWDAVAGAREDARCDPHCPEPTSESQP
jgi:hypothetical protein